ncbi:MAG TPA: PAS domain S-box protein [Candidatus Acidoferrales bacterium]|nr:PAS domain S-box protein [Candidatus Acidoferrales bacterium]
MLTDWLTRVLFKKDENNWPGIVAVFVALVSPIILLAILTYRQVYGDLTRNALSGRQAIAYLAATTLKEKLDRLLDLATYLATRVRFRRLVQAGDWKQAIDFLRSEPKDFQFVDRIFLADPDGVVMADMPRLPGARDKSLKNQDWYKGVRRDWQPYISPAYRRSPKPHDNVVAAAVPIRNEKQAIIGILVLEVRLATFFQWSRALDVGPTGTLQFVDRLGQLVADSKSLDQEGISARAAIPSVQRVLRGERGTAIFFEPSAKRDLIVSYEPVTQYGWGALAVEPAETAFAGRSEALARLLLICLLVLALGSSLSALILRTLADRQKTARALSKSEERRRSIIETARDAFVAIDERGTIIDWNRQAELTFGWSRSEALGQKMAELIIPVENRAAHSEGIERFLATGEGPILNRRVELTALHRSGKTFPVGLIVWPVKSDEGTTFNAFCRDITEYKRAQETRSTLIAIVESCDDAIVGCSLEGAILSWNRGARNIYGYTAEEALGQPVSMLSPPDRADEIVESLARLRRGERIDNYRTERVRKDGKRIHVSLTISPIRDAAGKVVGISSISRDITERIQAEQAIDKLHEDLRRRALELEAANRELESFCYSVSHDLRAPLRGINGFAQALLEDYSGRLDEVGKGYLQRVCAASQHMGELIDDLLSLSRLARQEMRRETVDLSALAAAIAAELEQAEPERAAEFVIAPGLLAEGDHGLLRVALRNLLENAWKFTSKRAHARIEFGRIEENGNRSYYVRDNGAGFDMAYAGKLFRAFQRLHSASEFEGTGIGLATVQRIIYRHGGRVWAEAAPDQGATFYFTLC